MSCPPLLLDTVEMPDGRAIRLFLVEDVVIPLVDDMLMDPVPFKHVKTVVRRSIKRCFMSNHEYMKYVATHSEAVAKYLEGDR